MSYTKSEMKNEIKSWIKAIFIAVVIGLLIQKLLIVNANVVSGSMENTIMTHDRVVAWRLEYILKDPQRNDIVVFKATVDNNSLFVKRIIGVGGDKINIIDGQLYINDEKIEENYLKEAPLGSFGPYIIPEEHLFMMGDNRNWSDDSRMWSDKDRFVPIENVEGKVVFKYYKGFEILK